MQNLTLYTTSWCPYCRALKDNLRALDVTYDEIDIEDDPEAAKLVMSLNGGNRTVPTVVFPDGSHATNPSGKAVKQRMDAAN